MSMHYINFYFRSLTYSNEYFRGEFSAPDNDVFCEFKYNRKTENFQIWNNNRPTAEILPLPVWWLEFKLKQKGTLNTSESKISF